MIWVSVILGLILFHFYGYDAHQTRYRYLCVSCYICNVIWYTKLHSQCWLQLPDPSYTVIIPSLYRHHIVMIPSWCVIPCRDRHHPSNALPRFMIPWWKGDYLFTFLYRFTPQHWSTLPSVDTMGGEREPSAVDGGFGWVVLTASFINQVILLGKFVLVCSREAKCKRMWEDVDHG